MKKTIRISLVLYGLFFLMPNAAWSQRPNNFYIQGGQTSANGGPNLADNFQGKFFFGFGAQFNVASFLSLGFAVESSLFEATDIQNYLMPRLDTSKFKYFNLEGGDTYSSLAAFQVKLCAFNKSRIRPYALFQPGLAVVSVSGFKGTNPQNKSNDLLLDSQFETTFGYGIAGGVEFQVSKGFGVFLQAKYNSMNTASTFNESISFLNYSFGLQLCFGGNK